MVNDVNSNFSPSKRPLSLSFNFGITSNAINSMVINGSLRGDPNFFDKSFISRYSAATLYASSFVMMPATGKGRHFSISSAKTANPPLF